MDIDKSLPLQAREFSDAARYDVRLAGPINIIGRQIHRAHRIATQEEADILFASFINGFGEFWIGLGLLEYFHAARKANKPDLDIAFGGGDVGSNIAEHSQKVGAVIRQSA